VVELILLSIGVIAFGKLPGAWNNPDSLALFNILFQIFWILLGMAMVASKIVQLRTRVVPREYLVATNETLAIKTVVKPIVFVRRRDCVALSHNGFMLLMADGRRHYIHACGVDIREMESFLAKLYDLWWPGLTRAHVQAHLKQREPRIWPLLFLPIVTMPLTGLIIVNLDSKDSLLSLTIILLSTIMVAFGFIAWCFYRVQISIARNQYPLHDANDHPGKDTQHAES